MANHLSDLLDACRSGELLFSQESSPRWHEHAPALAVSLGANAVCFDAGRIESMVGFRVVPELARLPYETCWIEFESEDNFVCALLTEEGKGVGGHIWTKNKASRDWMFRCAFLCANDGGKTQFQAIRSKEDADQLNEVVAAFRCFLCALNCTNVRRVEHKADEKLQKARARRGKRPLFSTWTLELDLSRPESGDSLGGTHASPRLHLRRGHARQYAPGKWTWVQPCVVGNKAAGMIHKDYRVAP